MAIAIHPKRDIRVTVQRDDTQLEDHELGNTGLELGARTQILLDIEGIAELRISGGAEDARRQLDRLQQRWEQEAVPLLKGAGAVTLDQLAQAADETDRKKREIEAARNAAVQLDQRIADQLHWEEIVGERRKQYEAAERLAQGVDRDKLEKAALKLGLRDVPAADKRLQILRVQHDKLISAQNELANRLAGDQGRQTEKQNALETARKELAQAESQVDGDWRQTRQPRAERQEAIARELIDIQAEIASLTGAEDQSVEVARRRWKIASGNCLKPKLLT